MVIDKEFKKLFLYSLLAYIIIYGFELTHFTLSIDEEFIRNNYQALSLGRWGHELLHKYLFPEPYTPFSSLLFALLMMAAASALSSRYLGLTGNAAVIYVVLIAAMPQFAYQAQFTQQVDTVSLAIAASCASVFFLGKGVKGALIFILLTVFSLSIYQSTVTVPLVLVISRLLLLAVTQRNNLTFKSVFKKLLTLAVLLVIAFIINSLLLALVLKLYNVRTTDYISDIVMWHKASFRQNLYHIFSNPLGSYFIKPTLGFLLFPLCIIPCLFLIYRGVKHKNVLMTIGLVAGLFAAVFALNVASGGGLPARTYVSLPFAFSLLATLFLTLISFCDLTRFGLCALLLVSGSYQSSTLFYSDFMAREADSQFANRVLAAIYNKYPDFDENTTPIFFYGSYHPVNKWAVDRGTGFGVSFFDWDGGNDARIINYFATTNKAQFRNGTVEQKNGVLDDANKMPAWPNPGAIEINDNILIVKLSPKLNTYNIDKLDRR